MVQNKKSAYELHNDTLAGKLMWVGSSLWLLCCVAGCSVVSVTVDRNHLFMIEPGYNLRG